MQCVAHTMFSSLWDIEHFAHPVYFTLTNNKVKFTCILIKISFNWHWIWHDAVHAIVPFMHFAHTVFYTLSSCFFSSPLKIHFVERIRSSIYKFWKKGLADIQSQVYSHISLTSRTSLTSLNNLEYSLLSRLFSVLSEAVSYPASCSSTDAICFSTSSTSFCFLRNCRLSANSRSWT